MSPAFSHDFLKRLSAFSKLSSGSTITLVTRNSPLSHSPEALPVYHAPLPVATRPQRAVLAGRAGCPRAELGGRPPGTTLTRQAADKGPAASLAPSAAGSTYSKY